MESVESSIKFGQLIIPGKFTSALPLQETSVSCQITGLTAQTRVVQHFTNPLQEPVELEYLFPLPQRAALVDFELKIGERQIKADLQELEQAQKAYEQASQNGQQAALLEQHRPNLFAIRLANVMPGQPIQAQISYDERLSLRDSELEFVFPMGLTPRYTSPSAPEEGVGVNPPVALPGEPVGPVKLQIHIDLGVEAGQPHSPSHPLLAEKTGPGHWQVRLAAESIPDHDFVLRIPVPGSELELAAWCSRDTAGETILVNWLPPVDLLSAPVSQPRDFIFVLDRSGSMTGQPIQQARNALRACLRILEPNDHFRILLFDDRLEWYRPGPVQISQAELKQADTFLDSIEGRGGTEIIAALEAAISAPGAEGKTRTILFLTDGAVSAEERAISALRKAVRQARIFTFGIGPSVNRALLSSLAKMGRGAAEFLQLDEDIEGAILRFQDKIAFPLLTEIQLVWTGCKAWDIYPEPLPDLYAGDALELTARLNRTSSSPAQVILSGKRGQTSLRIPLTLPATQENQASITRAWARARVDALQDQIQAGGKATHLVRQEIIQLAIEHHLLTPFTAFVAIDSQVVNPQGKTQPVQIAQPLPKGLDWSGFFPAPQTQMKGLRMPSMPFPAPSAFIQSNLRSMDSAQPEETPPGQNRQDKFSKGTLSISETSGDLTPFTNASPDFETILRGLARSQNLDGSWQGEVEHTAAALLAFVRHGHTTRKGNFRKQMQRARQWLVQAQAAGLPAYARLLALAELAQAEQDSQLDLQVHIELQQLASPSSPFEQAVWASLSQAGSLQAAPAQCSILNELRLASALKLQPNLAFSISSNDPTSLALVWWATLK